MTDRSLDIVIVDSDEVYLKRLACAISAGGNNNRNNDHKNFIVRAFSETGKAINLLRVSQPDALIVGQGCYCEEFRSLFSGKTIILTEEEAVSDQEVCRYRPVQSIIEAVGNPVRKRSLRPERRDLHITGVMSFCEAEYKNAYALALAAREGLTKKVLYINLDEFSQLRSKFKTSGGYTISDALYAYRQGSVDSEFIKRSIGHTESFDFFAPTPCADDLAGLKAREINKFICDIAEVYGYNRVILDVGYALSEPWEVFKFCDDADMPFKDGMEGRLSEFGEYMHQSGKTFILDVIKQVKLSPELLPCRDESWFDGEDKKWLDWLVRLDKGA